VEGELFLELSLVIPTLQGPRKGSGAIMAIVSAQTLCSEANHVIADSVTKLVITGFQWNTYDVSNLITGVGDLLLLSNCSIEGCSCG
jgi:hypothetical protein